MGEDELNKIDRKVLETALYLAVGGLSTWGKYASESPQKLLNDILQHAREILQDSN